MCDPAVILIERVHQSFKCNTRPDIEHPFPGWRLTELSRLTLSCHLSNRGPPRQPPLLFLFLCLTQPFLPLPFFLSAILSPPFPFPFPFPFPGISCIISYALLNKSARTAITIDTGEPCLSLSFSFSLFHCEALRSFSFPWRFEAYAFR